MTWLDEILAGQEEDAEDRTVYVRETPGGDDRIDFSITERTRFQSAYPETTKELRWAPPLSCGHIITQEETPFGAYCQAILKGEERCNKECCRQCIIRCSHCGTVVGQCHATEFEDEPVCKDCKRKLRRKRFRRSIWEALISPFTGEAGDDTW